jgi:hypothetical protein
MRFERVLQIWDYYDGVRSGVALFNGVPHYFECIWDESVSNYSDLFHLYPVSEEFRQKADQQWAIFRSERRAAEKAHPGHDKINSDYDMLRAWLDSQVKSLAALPARYSANFRALPGQDELEAVWIES